MTSRQTGDVTREGRDQPAGDPGGPGAGGGRPGRQPWRAAFFALAAAAIVGGVAWALLDSRFFVVRSVHVTGTHLVTGAEVRSAAAIPPGLPLIRVNSAAVDSPGRGDPPGPGGAGQPELAGRDHDRRHREDTCPGRAGRERLPAHR